MDQSDGGKDGEVLIQENWKHVPDKVRGVQFEINDDNDESAPKIYETWTLIRNKALYNCSIQCGTCLLYKICTCVLQKEYVHYKFRLILIFMRVIGAQFLVFFGIERQLIPEKNLSRGNICNECNDHIRLEGSTSNTSTGKKVKVHYASSILLFSLTFVWTTARPIRMLLYVIGKASISAVPLEVHR